MRILILEDDSFIAMDLQAILEEEGHEIVGIYSSIQEVKEHLKDNFDYALLDIDVIGGKSFEVAEELLRRRIPFAFVSASLPSDMPVSLKESSFIPKPFEGDMILRSVGQSASLVPLS